MCGRVRLSVRNFKLLLVVKMTISKILKLSIFELTSDQYQVRNLNKSVTNWYGL